MSPSTAASPTGENPGDESGLPDTRSMLRPEVSRASATPARNSAAAGSVSASALRSVRTTPMTPVAPLDRARARGSGPE